MDAGAHTIAYHLTKRHGVAPSVATIWRILSRRGFVIPQPQKRPRSSFVRFEAAMPNERWQADITHWRLGGGTEEEILNVIDDHSRFLVASGPAGRHRSVVLLGVQPRTEDTFAGRMEAGDRQRRQTRAIRGVLAAEHERLVRALFIVTGSAEEADELMQDAFVMG